MSDAPTDREGLEVLSFDECLDLVDSMPVGRVAFVAGGEPMILPVNHRRDGRTVVFRSAVGETLDAAGRRATAAFEVDDYDEDRRDGWSVLMRGTLDIETDSEALERLEQLDLHPWADEVDRRSWVRLRPTVVTGRRIPQDHADPQ